MSPRKEELLCYRNEQKQSLYQEVYKYYSDNHYSFLAKLSIDFTPRRKFTSLIPIKMPSNSLKFYTVSQGVISEIEV